MHSLESLGKKLTGKGLISFSSCSDISSSDSDSDSVSDSVPDSEESKMQNAALSNSSPCSPCVSYILTIILRF